MNYDTTMERMMRHSDTALRQQTAKAQALEHALKEAETQVTGLHQRLQTAEQQISRMYDDLDAKDRELARALAWARVWKWVAKRNYIGHKTLFGDVCALIERWQNERCKNQKQWRNSWDMADELSEILSIPAGDAGATAAPQGVGDE